jgi:hypothetical protein
MSIAQLLLALSWRTIVALAISTAGGIIFAIASFIFGRFWPVGAQNFVPEATAFNIALYLLGIGILLWVATVFSLIRFGWRSAIATTGLLASVLCSASFCFFRSPAFAIALAIMWVSFFIFSASSAKRRQSFGILFTAVAIGWLTGFALSTFFHDPHSIFGMWQSITALFLLPIVESSITVFLHRRFIAFRTADVQFNAQT